MTVARWILLMLVLAGQVHVEPAARITEYAPALGPINHNGDPQHTACMEHLTPGITAACGPDIPCGTRVYIADVGWRTCTDRGGLISNQEVDVLVHPDEYLQWGIDGHHWTLWVRPGALKSSGLYAILEAARPTGRENKTVADEQTEVQNYGTQEERSGWDRERWSWR